MGKITESKGFSLPWSLPSLCWSPLRDGGWDPGCAKLLWLKNTNSVTFTLPSPGLVRLHPPSHPTLQDSTPNETWPMGRRSQGVCGWLPLSVWPHPPVQQTTENKFPAISLPDRAGWGDLECCLTLVFPPTFINHGYTTASDVDTEPPWVAASCQQSRRRMNKNFIFAFLQMYQPGEEKWDIDLSHMFRTRKPSLPLSSGPEHNILLFF